jgi:MFS family permease
LSDLDPDQKLQEVDQELPQEPTAMGVESKRSWLPKQLSAFRHRNYRLFFSGQLISLTGTWLQSVALGWLVYELTGSQLLLGTVSAIGALPIFFLSLPAGILIDRINKRDLLIATQTTAMLLAFALAGLTHWRLITVYWIVLLGFLLGVVNAFDAPARQSFVIDMVGREDLPNAIAMNSAMFNGARIVGPAMAGILLAITGIAGVFFLNGLSFIAVIAGLLLMNVPRMPPRVAGNAWLDIKEGLQFVRGHRRVRGLLILTAVVSIFSMSYSVLMPVFAKDILKVGAGGLGFLMSMAGVGALIGAATISSLGDFRGKGRLLLVGNLTFSAMLICFSFSRIWPLSLGILFVAGWGMMINMALTNTLIQTAVPDELRGRVMSLYTWMFLGMAPIGSFQAGAIAHLLGAPHALQIGAAICAVTAISLSPMFLTGQQAAEADRR